MITEPFQPNELTAEDIPNLADWQLLVAAMHFAPRMTDCVQLDYGYEFRSEFLNRKIGGYVKNRIIYVGARGEFHEEIDLGSECELVRAAECLTDHYTPSKTHTQDGVEYSLVPKISDWRKFAAERILNNLE